MNVWQKQTSCHLGTARSLPILLHLVPEETAPCPPPIRRLGTAQVSCADRSSRLTRCFRTSTVDSSPSANACPAGSRGFKDLPLFMSGYFQFRIYSMTATNDPSASEPSPHLADSAANPASVAPDVTAIPAGAVDAEEGPSIPLPPPPLPPEKQTSPEQLAAEIARQDRALVAVVLALAFLLASVAVRNSDFWMHLASGRLIAN